jgi:hypothetical protein
MLNIEPEKTVAMLGVLGLAIAAMYGIWRWLWVGPRTPEPWGAECESAMEEGSAVPVCPTCLYPQEHDGWFCPECGSSFGPYINYLPGVYIFSLADPFRAGIRQARPWSPWAILFYFLVAFYVFSILAPFYCALLLANRLRAEKESQPKPPLLNA